MNIKSFRQKDYPDQYEHRKGDKNEACFFSSKADKLDDYEKGSDNDTCNYTRYKEPKSVSVKKSLVEINRENKIQKRPSQRHKSDVEHLEISSDASKINFTPWYTKRKSHEYGSSNGKSLDKEQANSIIHQAKSNLSSRFSRSTR